MSRPVGPDAGPDIVLAHRKRNHLKLGRHEPETRAAGFAMQVLEEDTLIAGGGGGSTVEVLVPRTRVARLLQAIANDDALSVVPTGLPLGSP